MFFHYPIFNVRTLNSILIRDTYFSQYGIFELVEQYPQSQGSEQMILVTWVNFLISNECKLVFIGKWNLQQLQLQLRFEWNLVEYSCTKVCCWNCLKYRLYLIEFQPICQIILIWSNKKCIIKINQSKCNFNVTADMCWKWYFNVICLSLENQQIEYKFYFNV